MTGVWAVSNALDLHLVAVEGPRCSSHCAIGCSAQVVNHLQCMYSVARGPLLAVAGQQHMQQQTFRWWRSPAVKKQRYATPATLLLYYSGQTHSPAEALVLAWQVTAATQALASHLKPLLGSKGKKVGTFWQSGCVCTLQEAAVSADMLMP